MHKFRNIEIEAFRVYNERQKFNFEKDGEIVNLAVIYGPNGFGKTSFNDAVEWGFTKEIGRISKNSITLETVNYEKGEILKNKYSSREEGEVVFEAEDTNKLIRTTAKLNGKTKKDYLGGQTSYVGNTFQGVDKDFGIKNILSHDQIDAFLKAITPEERYLELVPFWDDDNTTEIYNEIYDDYRELNKRLDKKNKEIKEAESVLESIKMDFRRLLNVDSLISNFNEEFNKNLEINIAKYTNEKMVSLFKEIGETKQAIDYKRTEIQNTKKELEWLLATNKSYNEKINTAKILEIQIENSRLEISKFDKLEVAIKHLGELKNMINENKYLLNKYVYMVNNYKSYSRIKNEIKTLNADIEKFREELLCNIEIIKNNDIELSTSKKKLEEREEKLGNLRQVIDNVGNYIQKYIHLQQAKNKYIKKTDKIKQVINIRENRIGEFKAHTSDLNKYLVDNIQILFELENDEEYISVKIQHLKNLDNEIENNRNRLRDKEDFYFNLGEINEKVNLILKNGEAYIEQSQDSKCPLCSTKFLDYQTLLNQIKSGFSNTAELEKSKQEIDLLKILIEKKQAEMKEKHNDFVNYIKSIIKNTLKTIDLEVYKINKIQNIDMKYQNKLHIIDEDIINIHTKFRTYELEDLLKDTKFDEIDLILKKKENDLKEIISNDRTNIEAYKKLITNVSNRNIALENDIQHREVKIEAIRKEDIFTLYNEILQQLKIRDEIDEINLTRNQLIKEEKEVEDKILKNKELIQQLGEEGVSEGNLEDKVRYCEVYKKEVELLTINKAELESYESKYYKLTNHKVEVISREHIIELMNTLEKEVSSLAKKIDIVDKLSNGRSIIEDSVAYSEKDKDLREKREERQLINKVLDHVDLIYRDTTNYIEEKINKVFNSEIINYIYSRIEPHPQLTQIKFEPDFTGDKPKIHIYTMGKGEEKASPILYLSSAQLNILSLSIFYARALQNCDIYFRTVFMDDPVEHLDDINILSFIDLLRTIITELDIQVIMSTHDERFFNLLKRKLHPKYYKSKFIQLESYGKIK
jgi:DNA repair exonuclease SbcCD ATPase subunit